MRRYSHGDQKKVLDSLSLELSFTQCGCWGLNSGPLIELYAFVFSFWFSREFLCSFVVNVLNHRSTSPVQYFSNIKIKAMQGMVAHL